MGVVVVVVAVAAVAADAGGGGSGWESVVMVEKKLKLHCVLL
jgi:hypothetical protein